MTKEAIRFSMKLVHNILDLQSKHERGKSIPLHIDAEQSRRPVHIVGNINEALDVWYEDIMFPDMTDQKYIALINAGAYSSSMASNHCMRGHFREFLLL